jgi:fatty acid-binding protein DegV
VRVVTDSTCDLPQELVRAHGIHVVPLAVIFGDRVYHDGVDLKPRVVGVGHAKAPVWADRLRSLIERRFRVAELLVAEIGPVVGTHAGPGAVGACFFQPTPEELPLVAPLPEAS